MKKWMLLVGSCGLLGFWGCLHTSFMHVNELIQLGSALNLI